MTRKKEKALPGSSNGKESACNSGDPGSIPGSGRSPGEGHGNLFQCSFLENSTEEPGKLQSMGSQSARHDWVTNTHTHSLLQSPFLCCCCSITTSCLTLCDPRDCAGQAPLSSTVYQIVLKFMSFESVMLTSLSSAAPFSFCLQSFPASGPSPMSPLFTSGGQSIGASVSAIILPGNIQGWFPLGLTGLIFLQSKGLSRVSSFL